MHSNLLKKVSTACLHMALSMSALSAVGATQSYYRTRRGSYSGGRNQYVVDPNIRPISTTSFTQRNSSVSKKAAMSAVRSNFNSVKGQRVRELLIVDGSVQDKSLIFNQAQPGVEIVEIKAGEGLNALLKILANYSQLDAVHIVSHASSGVLQIGGEAVNQKTFENNVAAFASVNNAIREGGDLMLYGCDLAKGEEGNDFLQIIKDNTHADVAASTDKTGNAEYGANWELEIQKGDIEAKPLPESIAMKDFTRTLQFTGTIDFSQVKYAGDYTTTDPAVNAEFWESPVQNHVLIVDGATGPTYTFGDYASFGAYYAETSVVLRFASDETFNPKSVKLYNWSGTTCRYTITSDKGGSVTTGVLPASNGTETLDISSLPSGTSTLTITSNGAFWGAVDNLEVENLQVAAANTAPTVTTTSISTFDATSATLGGNVTDDGGDAVTERGVVYSSLDATPEIGEGDVTKDTNGSGTGSFSESISGLSAETTYYVSAYATNSEGTSYGSVESFTTAPLTTDITITSSASSGSGWSLSGEVLTATASVLVNYNEIENALADGDLIISSSRDIIIDADIAPALSANRTLTLKADRDITMETNSSIAATGFALNTILWSDTDALEGGMAYLKTQAEILTNGGHLWIGGGNGSTTWNGLTVGDGTSIGNVNNSNGITLVKTNIQTNGGSIAFYGKGMPGATPGVSIPISTGSSTNTDGIRMHDGNSINAGAGTIYMYGFADNSNATSNSNGVELSQTSGAGDVITSSNNTENAIFIEGYAEGPATVSNSWGFYTHLSTIQNTGGGNIHIKGSAIKDAGVTVAGNGTVLANSGKIILEGTASGASSYSVFIQGAVGQKTGTSVLSSSADIEIIGDKLSISGTAPNGRIQSSGVLAIRPYTASTDIGMGSATSTLQLPASYFNTNFVDGFSEIIVGDENAGLITVEGATVYRDQLTIKTKGNIFFTADADLSSAVANPLTLWTRASGNNEANDTNPGAIWIPQGSVINTAGGDLTLGGGTDPKVGYALGDGAATSGENNARYRGIAMNGSIDAAGGNIIINGRGANTIAHTRGISIGGPIKTTGAANITVRGIGRGASDAIALGDVFFTPDADGTLEAGTGSIILVAEPSGPTRNGLNLSTSGSYIKTNGNFSTTTTGRITATAGSLDIGGNTNLEAGDNIVLTNANNDFDGSITVNGATNLQISDQNELTLGDISVTGTIDIATLNGDLNLTENIITTDASTDAITLFAGKGKFAGDISGGNVIISGSPSINTGSGGRARLYSGSEVGSTGLATLVGASNVRFNVDATTSTFTPALGAGNYALFREIPLATLTTDNVTTFDAVSATMGGEITDEGGATVSDRGVVWATTTEPTTSDNKVQIGSGDGVFSNAVGSLPSSTTIYVRAYAINSYGTAYGNEVSFTTADPNNLPTASNVTFSGTLEVGQELTGSYDYADADDDDEGGSTYQWSRSDDALGTNKAAISGAASITYTLAAADENKYISFEVTPNDGTDAGTAVESSLAGPVITLPTVTTASATDIGATSAKLGGEVTDDGSASVTERGVVYNTTGNPKIEDDTKVAIGDGSGSFSATISGLTSGTTYYIRAYATNGAGTEYGSEESFATPSAPSFTTTPVTEVDYDHVYSYGIVATQEGDLETILSATTLPDWLSFSTDGQNQATQFGDVPTGVALSGVAGDEEGNIYAIRQNGIEIFKITPDGTTTSWKSGLLNGQVYALHIADGYIYIPRYLNSTASITRVPLNDPSEAEETFASFTGGALSLTDKDGWIYAANYSDRKIMRINQATKVVETLLTDADGVPSNGPFGLTFDEEDNLYIATWQNKSILKYDGTDINTMLNSLPNYVSSIKVDKQGNFYLSMYNGGIRKYNSDFSDYSLVSPNDTDNIWSLSFTNSGALMYAIYGTNGVYRLQTGAVLTGTPDKSQVGDHEVVLKASNDAGYSEQIFTIHVQDNVAPVVQAYSPANTATDIALQPTLSLTFDEEITLGNEGSLNLYAGESAIQTFDLSVTAERNKFSLSADQKTLSLSLEENLPLITVISVEIENGAGDNFAEDAHANAFAGFTAASSTWTFTTIDNNSPTASNVAISGTLEVGEALTGSYDYADADDDHESGTTFQWYRSDDASGTNKTAIADADTKTYTLAAADEGKYISFVVTPNDGTYAGMAIESNLEGPVTDPTPDINIKGNNTSIADGNNTPSADDHTNFGSVAAASGTVSRTFTIENTGTADLTLMDDDGQGYVTIDGTHAGDFSIGDEPSATVTPGNSVTFTLAFDPAAVGERTATVSIHSNDPDENSYTFALQGNGANTAPTASNVTISGTLEIGEELTGNYEYADADEDAESGSVYQWYRSDDASGTNKIAIAGATTQTYTLATVDKGKYISFEVTPNDGADAGTAMESASVSMQINTAPSFTSGSDQTVLEDAGVQSVSGWATHISAGPADENGQALTFNVSNDNESLFSAQPEITANGTLTYTPAADAFGTATITISLTDDGGTANEGKDTSEEVNFTITVAPVNDAPSFTAGGDHTVPAGAASQHMAGWASDIGAGANNESAQQLTFHVSNDQEAFFTTQPAINNNGDLSFTLAEGVSGSVTVNVSLSDDGGTHNGGEDTSEEVPFTINIGKLSQVITFETIDDKMVGQDPVVLDATGGDSGLPITYTITTDPASGVASLVDNTIVIENVGTVTVTATQAGNELYEAAANVSHTFSISANELFLPTLFTPNGDGNNDRFILRGGGGVATLTFSILDRDNNLVYQTPNWQELTQQGWDGTHNGKKQPLGTYVWVINGKYTNGLPLLVNGKNTGIIRLLR